MIDILQGIFGLAALFVFLPLLIVRRNELEQSR